MSKRDYYEVLGVSRDVNEADLKKAYRRLAMKYHPDRNQNDKDAESRFKEAKEAYDVLSDAQKRAAYDQFGHAGVDPSAGTGGGLVAAAAIRSVISSAMFSAISSAVAAEAGAEAAPEEALICVTTWSCRWRMLLPERPSTYVYPHWWRVRAVTARVRKKAPAQPPVATCGGVGQVRMQQGFFSVQQTCPNCRGQGTTISDPCPDCHGQGRTQKHKTLSVKVPAGVDNGDRIRLAGEGEAGEHGGPSGDLYVQIQVKPHPIFRREENDLMCEMPISIGTATLGGELEVPTLSGRLKLKIPAETQSGKVFRMRGKGVKSVRGGAAGDLLCRVSVETPVNLNSQQKELLREFEDSIQQAGKHHSPQSASWMDRVKSFFDELTS